MLDVEESEPGEIIQRVQAFYFVIGDVQLDQFCAGLQRLERSEKVELELSFLKVAEVLDALEGGHLLEGQL